MPGEVKIVEEPATEILREGPFWAVYGSRFQLVLSDGSSRLRNRRFIRFCFTPWGARREAKRWLEKVAADLEWEKKVQQERWDR